MKVAISVVRPFHIALMANALRRHADSVVVYSSAPRRFFGKLDDTVETHLVPSPSEIMHRFMPLPRSASLRGIALWDRMVAASIPTSDLVIGMATQSLSTGRATHQRSGRFVLDRACPHVDFQQELSREEAANVGSSFEPEPAWFRERQVAEYEIADSILTPSDYTARSFPPALRSKCVIAPLLGRVSAKGEMRLERNSTFTVGVLGGDPLRKGYLYLLQAWKRLAWPGAKLVIRSSSDFSKYPRLQELLRELPSVEILDYIPNISEFYQRCDLFVLPSVDDGFGMALFEAMANGVPCISTRNCGASELVTDGVDGLVIEPRSVEQLAAAMQRLFDHEDERHALAVAAQETVTRISASGLYERALLQVLHEPYAAEPPIRLHA